MSASVTHPANTAPDDAAPDDVAPDGAAAPGSWRLRRRLGRFFMALGGLLAVIAAVLVVAAIKFALTGNDVVYRDQPALSASQRMLADLVNQETGVRGYLLTRQPAALAPYTDYLAMQKVDTARVRDLVGGDSGIAEQVDRFDAAASAWQREIAHPVIAAIRAGRKADAGAVDAGRVQFNRIRRSGADLQAAVLARAQKARSARVVEGVFAGVALGLSILLVAATGFALWRGLHRWVIVPVDDLAAQAREVADGELTRAIDGRGPGEVVDLAADIERMRAQIVAELTRAEQISQSLEQRSAELERSNADLQQFAYVASHDLSEPLRKVANFCQLLERQYGPQLDDRARQYIDFAVDGAKRMQALINDLLALSRVGRSTESFVSVDLGAALDQALSTLSERIRASGATVDRLTDLPVVSGDRPLLTSLLENLVGNAVKYRRDDVAPMVTVAAERSAATAGTWTLTVSDNGIGIDEQYAERIFAVFQRLHLRDQYGGTGIGLALCRRIVEFHGGRIWLETVQSVSGATFKFTLLEGGPRAERIR